MPHNALVNKFFENVGIEKVSKYGMLRLRPKGVLQVSHSSSHFTPQFVDLDANCEIKHVHRINIQSVRSLQIFHHGSMKSCLMVLLLN